MHCRAHAARHNQRQNIIRRLRHQLGFCLYCLARAVPGRAACPYHLAKQAAGSRRWLENKKRQRGWKLMRVAL
jgi:hypothetical protein